LFFTFFLDKKTNKKVKAIRPGTFRRSKISSDESPVGSVCYLTGLNSVTPFRAIMRFLEALNFLLHVYYRPNVIVSKK
jgi:hypothetical protein